MHARNILLWHFMVFKVLPHISLRCLKTTLRVDKAGVIIQEATANADCFGVKTYSHCLCQTASGSEPELDAFSVIGQKVYEMTYF